MVGPSKDQMSELRRTDPDERIIWSERPKPRFFTPDSLFEFLVATPFTALCVYDIPGVFGYLGFRADADWMPSLILIVSSFLGFWLMSSPIREYFKSFHTIYMITNKRAVIIERADIQSFPPETFRNISLKMKRNGTGNIDFTPGDETSVGFWGIGNPKKVAILLGQLAGTCRMAE